MPLKLSRFLSLKQDIFDELDSCVEPHVYENRSKAAEASRTESCDSYLSRYWKLNTHKSKHFDVNHLRWLVRTHYEVLKEKKIVVQIL